MIRARQLTLKRGARTVLTGIDFEVPPGTIATVVGRNGAGKSTLLAAVSGELAPASGQVCYGSHDVARLSLTERAACRSALSQQLDPAFSMSCADVIELGTYPVYDRLTRGERKAICAAAAASLDVTRFAGRPLDTLSGGERQRVWLAKCLAQLRAGRHVAPGPQALLLDEPTASLDVAQQARLLQLVRRLARDESIAVLCVLHDLNLAAQLSDRIILLEPGSATAAGHALAVGTPTEVFTRERLRRALGVDCLVQRHPRQPDCPLLTILHETSADDSYLQASHRPDSPTPEPRPVAHANGPAA